MLWAIILAAGTSAAALIGGTAARRALQRRRARRQLQLSRLEGKLQRARDDLRASEERYALAAVAANDGLWDWDLRRNRCRFSARWKQLLGYEDHQIGDDPQEWLGRVHRDDIADVRAAINAHLDARTAHLEIEYRMRHRDRGYRWVLTRGVAVRDLRGIPTRVAGSQTDVTARKLAEQQLRHAALHDALTGLPNRAYFLDTLARAVARAKRAPEHRIAVLFLDLDRFKLVNDSLGHGAGDYLLGAVARRLENCVRPGDLVARLGGDEFAVLLHDVHGIDDATTVAERIHGELAHPFQVLETDMLMGASIGIAVGGEGYEAPEDLLRDADIAMYRAKAQGKGRHEVFDAHMREAARARVMLEGELRRALDRGEFLLHYQPISKLADGEIVAFEALVRWAHPRRGLLNAAAFVPLAEETGFINPIGQWVMREACRQLREWQARYPASGGLSVSVNLCAREVMQPRIVRHVDEVLRETGVAPQALRLEITESLFLDDADAAVAMLRELAALGVRIHLDDFGTGYSSLSYLHRFPISSVKIDRYFVSRLGGDQECAEIVRTILGLARTLGMEVIAEGAETEEQRAQLQAMACPYIQGFVCSRPLSADDAGRLLAAQIQPELPLTRPAIVV